MEAQAPGAGREAGGCWLFQDAAFDILRAELSVAGQPVELDRSAQEVLLCLLAKAGNVATKAELMEAGWPGRIVAENSLTKAIGRLRRALSDDDGKLVRAVHGYGYRLAAEARFVPATSADAPDTRESHRVEGTPITPGSRVPQFPGWQVLSILQNDSRGLSLIAEGPDPALGKRMFRQTRREAGLHRMRHQVATFEHLRNVRPGLEGLQPLLDWRLSSPPFTVVTAWMGSCDLNTWSLRDGNRSEDARPRRLRLLGELARTIEDLHAVGVIHGDIRPGNIDVLPAGDGEPAVLLSIPDSAWEFPAKQTGTAPAANLHTAPEVLAGEAPTARSDLYSLGVLLFQSVVGDYTRPLAPGWEDQVPDPLLREDIALAAHVDPARRLATVQDLARRIGSREARQHAARERLLLERHAEQERRTRLRVGVALAAALVMAVMLVLSVHHENRLAAARDDALAAARLAAHHEEVAQEVTSFLVSDVLGNADPYSRGGEMPDLREAMDRAAGNLQGRFTDKPEVAAAIHHALGKSYQGLNEYGRANDHIGSAIGLSRDLEGASGRAIWLRALTSRCELAVYSRATPEAADICRSAIGEHHADDAPPARAEIFLALAELRMGAVQDAQNRLARVARFPGLDADPETLGYLQWFQAIAAQRLGKLEQAERAFAALTANRRVHAGDPGMLLAWALSEQGRALLDLGRTEEGEAMLRESRSMFDTVGGPDHPHSVAPKVHLMSQMALRGAWVQVSKDASRLRAQRVATTGWDQWTLRLALLEARARARNGERVAALQLLSDIDDFRVRSKLDDNYPWLLDEILLARAWSYLAIGDTQAARASIEERSRLTLVGPSVPEHAYIAQTCLEAELMRQEFSADQARVLESTCKTRLENRLPEESLLLLNMRF